MHPGNTSKIIVRIVSSVTAGIKSEGNFARTGPNPASRKEKWVS
jgi:hypothetical protein